MTTRTRREVLLDAADRVVGEQGATAPMAAIAAAAGITKPILYRWFGDKEGLYTALAARYAGELMAALETALRRRPGGRRDRTRALVEAYLRHAAERPGAFRFLAEAAPARAGFPAELGALLTAEVGRPTATPAWGAAAAGALQGGAGRWLAVREPDLDTLAAELTDLLCGPAARRVEQLPTRS